jgi:hypothetical protein
VAIIYLTSSSGDGRPPFLWSAEDRATEKINVATTENTEPGFLHEILGGRTIVQRITFQSSQDGEYYDLIYHPGQVFETAEAVWELVGSSLKFLAAHGAIRQHRAESGHPIPPHVWSSAADSGISGAATLHQSFNHVLSASHYPTEGYYFAKGEEPGAFIQGKVLPQYVMR